MTGDGEFSFGSLSSDLTSLILSLLPVPSLLRASAVCHLWNSLISSPSFSPSLAAHQNPWLFLHDNHNSFAFDPLSHSWFRLRHSLVHPKPDVSPPLPADFQASQPLSSALFGGKLYVYGIYSYFVSAFDLHKHVWSNVRTLRPPGVVFSFLMACEDKIVLGGLCNTRGGPSFYLWRVHEETLEFSEISVMPRDLLYSLAGGDEDDDFGSLKCVGSGRLVYVYSEEHHKNYPACVCEIGSGSDRVCSWRRLLGLPSPVDEFHKVVGFCSPVSLHDVLNESSHSGVDST